MLKLNETPNLLELVQAYGASVLADIPICGDEATDSVNGLSHSPPADEAEDA